MFCNFIAISIVHSKLCIYMLLYPPEASGGYFGLAFATLPPPPCVERFLALTL